MSIAFSDFDDPAVVANPGLTIATGLNGMGGGGWGGGAAVNVVASMAPGLVGPGAVAALNADVAYIAARWANRLEAERRVQIDAFIQSVMEPMAPLAPAVLPGRTVAEQTIAAGGGGGAAAQVGHGRLDYLIANPLPPGVHNRLRPSVIIEAKANIGALGMTGHWQLCAELATAKQLAGWAPRRTRGILTDGRLWKFYELESGAAMAGGPVLTHSAVYDVTVVLDLQQIIARLEQYLVHYAAAGPLL